MAFYIKLTWVMMAARAYSDSSVGTGPGQLLTLFSEVLESQKI
jgi:hypothetical protein